jgi:copper(I)-binding protein
MIRTRRRFLVTAGAVVGAAMSAAVELSARERVSAENAWVPWAPPTVEVHAAYMTIVNRSNEDQSLVSAESPDYQRVELHSSSVKNGVNEMRGLERVAVPANNRVTFEPGGLHLMLIGPKRPRAVGDRVRIVLRLQNGEPVEVSAIVRRRNAESPVGHDHHGAHQ